MTRLLAADVVATLLLCAGCGSSAVPEVVATAPIEADVGADVPQSVGDASVEADAGPMADREPEGPIELVMKGRELKGPYRSRKAACDAMDYRNGGGKCLKGKSAWVTGAKLGEHGGFLSVETGRAELRREKSFFRGESCLVLIETSAGWWAEGHLRTCVDKGPLTLPVDAQLTGMAYADDLGEGVLYVDRTGETTLWKKEQQDGKQVSTSLDVHREERMYCAVDSEGIPRCTEWFITKCQTNERSVLHKNGKIVVVKAQADRDDCFDRVIEPGEYTLFEAGFLQSEQPAR